MLVTGQAYRSVIVQTYQTGLIGVFSYGLTGQYIRTVLPDCLIGHSYRTVLMEVLPDSLTMKSYRTVLLGVLTRQSYREVSPDSNVGVLPNVLIGRYYRMSVSDSLTESLIYQS
jgi:hypothetical protein